MKKIPRFVPSLTISELFTALMSGNREQKGVDCLEKFTKAFAQYIGVKYAIFVPSARIGLAGLLHALDLPKGGEVILPALTHQGIANIFRDFGLKVHYVDIHPATYCIDSDRVNTAINSSTVAIVPVHMYGRACNMTAINELAEKHDLVVIEDCAQACGSSYAGKRLGSFGQGAIFSLGPFKHVCALGSGMVVTNSPDVAAKIRSYVNQYPRLGSIGLMKRVIFTMGICSITKPLLWSFLIAPFLRICSKFGFDPIEEMTTDSPGKKKAVQRQTQQMPRPLQGAVGLSQLSKLDDLNNRRVRNGNKLLERLQGIDNIGLPAISPNGENVYLSFAVQVKEPDQFRRRMLSHGIDTHPGDTTFVEHLSGPEHNHECQIALNAINSMVHLPVYPQLEESEVCRVAEVVRLAANGIEE